MLKIDKVSRRFGNKVAVDRIDVEIPEGQMVGVIGRSGAGKSTLLRMINRLTDPTDGRIQFRGTDVTGLKGAELRAWRNQCAMIFQQFNLVPRIDVLTNVLLGRLNKRSTLLSVLNMFSHAERLDAVRALDQLDIAQTALQRAGTLSGGQQQRVAIARALMQDPRIILADEPIASLDPRNAQIVMDSLKSINERQGITVVTNLHTLDTARAYCNRIIGMRAGKVVFDGKASELTQAAAREIYGDDGLKEAFSEAITSTSLDALRGSVATEVAPKSIPAVALAT
jgi:phosphonate transport system ATP-binding protein